MEIVETLEIERRWLLSGSKEEALAILEMLESQFAGCKKTEIKQWYISTNPVVRLRSHDDEEFVLCIKTRGKGTGKGVPEKESELNKEEFDNLFKFITKQPVRKTRYYIPLENGFVAELDIFHNYLNGLIIVEVEFKDEESSVVFIPPSWFGNKEITGNKSYSNSVFYSLMPNNK